MKLSTRNALIGTVKKIEYGSVNSEITIQLKGGQELVSIITRSSSENLGLHVGKEVIAMIKATNIIIAIDD